MDIEWSNDASLELIRLYRNQPVLWNTKDGFYYSRVKKRKAWEKIASTMKMSVDDIKQKMNSLLGSFRRERSKMRRGYGNYTTRWFAFDHLLFVLDRKKKLPDSKVEDNPQDDEDDVTFDSDSNQLLEEELNEASHDVFTDEDEENLSADPLQSPPSKKMKTNHSGTPTHENLNTALPTVNINNECEMFAQYVACKLKKFNDRTRSFIERAINNVLFEADMGKFDNLPCPFDVEQQTASTDVSNRVWSDGFKGIPLETQK